MNENPALVAWSAKNVQEETLNAVKRFLPQGGRILELGAGTGRLSAILQSAGYQIVAGDWNSDQFAARDIVCHHVDCDDPGWLESEFGDKTFDAVICGDLIEHLKNPFQFISTISTKLLKRNGSAYLFVTTPNILSPSSRVNILVNVNPNSFGVGSRKMGHINPMFPSTLKCFECCFVECVRIVGIGVSRMLGEKSIRGFGQYLLSTTLRVLMRNVVHAPVLLFVGRSGPHAQSSEHSPVGTGTKGHYSTKK